MSSVLLMFALIAGVQSPLDRTIPVTGVSRILVDAQAGRISVRGSARPDMQVKGNVPFIIESDGSGLRIRPADARKVQEVVFEVDVPRDMPVRATGSFTDVSIADINGEVRIDVREGVIEIRGGFGSSNVHSVSGQVLISERTGPVTVMAATSSVKLVHLTGPINVDGTSGAITFMETRSSSVDVLTASGEITFAGAVAGDGRYAFTSRSGGVTLTIPAGTGATLTLLTASGVLEATPALVPISVEPGKLTKRVYRIGNAAGQIEIRSLNGRIVLNWSGKSQ